MSEIRDDGQQLTLRTRRGADLRLTLELTDVATEDPIDLTGAAVVSRIYADGKATVAFAYSIGGADNNQITLHLTAAQTLNMAQDWAYVLGFKLAGVTQPLLYGPLFVAQDQL